MKSLRRLLASGVLLGAGSAFALEWVSQTFTGTLAPLQATLDVAFAFKNTAETPVVIQDVETNCDCLGADTDKRIYQPGEAGVLTARFTVGDRFGSYERSIVVVTNHGSPQKLTMHVEVPEPFIVEPRNLDWPLGGPPDERRIDFRAMEGARVDFHEAFASNADFRVRLETIETGRHYVVFVQPVRTTAPGNAAIRLKGTTVDGQEIVVSGYVNIR